MSIFSTIAKAVTATGVVSGAAGVGSKMYLKNGHGFGTMDVNSTSNTTDSNTVPSANFESQPTRNESSTDQPQQVTDTTKTTYGSLLKEKKYELVKTETSNEIILNIMMERLDPTKDSLSYSTGQRFSGSAQVTFQIKKFDSRVGDKDYSLTVLQKPQESFINSWKQSCITALDREVDRTKAEKTTTDEGKELARLREWCTEPTVDQVLRRHKLTPLNTDNTNDDEKWKTVIAGGWFKKEGDKKNWEEQSFVSANEIDTFLKDKKETGISLTSEVTKEQIDFFKQKCKAELQKPFTRTNFYLTTQFIKGIKEDNKPTIDPFQELALFCVESMKASDYITKALQGDVQTSVVLDQSDYCYMTETSNNFDSWTTNNPLEGKSFWCAVKALYKAKSK
ncbi:hypothetical protein [Candidatus Mycoplasma haematohominis]|uniref:hypothetical protein n=1 Tax=Candidatus Mycoplasma haematohominis TaxID=1494318 RepID=UPI001C0A67C2|nr:hypothetical protein [Candidatus Mycoplasma haemohominis]